MRALTLILSALIVTLISTQVSAKEANCKIVTGYGTVIGRGPTLTKARENARLACGSAMIDQYTAQRGNIPDDVKDDLVLACVNLECQ